MPEPLVDPVWLDAYVEDLFSRLPSSPPPSPDPFLDVEVVVALDPTSGWRASWPPPSGTV